MTCAQITIFLDASGNYHCEAPGKNGARAKIDFDADSLPALLRAELIDQQHRIKKAEAEQVEAQRKQNASRHSRIVNYTADHYPSALPLVEPNPRKISAVLRSKYLEMGYSGAEIDMMERRGEMGSTAFFEALAHKPLEPVAAPAARAKQKPLTPSETLALNHALRRVEF